jgi:hypothetical protein
MAKADVTTLVSLLSNGVTNATTVSDYYDDVVEEVGRGVFQGVLSTTDAAFVQTVAHTHTYTLPAAAVRPLLVVYDDTQLAEDEAAQAADVDARWRTTRGKPIAFVRTDEEIRTIALVPTPDVSGADPTGLTPFDNTGFPVGNLTILYTDREGVFAADEELPVALFIMSREFQRDSDHCDGELSNMAAKLADLLLKGVHSPTCEA